MTEVAQKSGAIVFVAWHEKSGGCVHEKRSVSLRALALTMKHLEKIFSD